MYKGRENYETVKHLMTGEECIVTDMAVHERQF